MASYPAPRGNSLARSPRFAKLSTAEEKDHSEQQHAAAAAASNGRPAAYESSYTNALQGWPIPTARLPSRLFAPLAPFPVPGPTEVSGEGLGGARTYHPRRNPYGYRGRPAHGIDIDSDEEGEHELRTEMARRRLVELDAAGLDQRGTPPPPPRNAFQPMPTSPVLRPARSQPQQQQRAPPLTYRPLEAHERQQLSPPSAAVGAQSAPVSFRASHGDEAARTARHQQHTSRLSTPPYVITPSFTPAQVQSRSPIGITPPPPASSRLAHEAPSASAVALTSRQRQRDHMGEIWAAEEEMEVINRRRILSAQVFDQETRLREAALEKQRAVLLLAEEEQLDARRREQQRKERTRGDAERRVNTPPRNYHASFAPASEQESARSSFLQQSRPTAAAEDDGCRTPINLTQQSNRTIPASAYRPGLSMEALESSPVPAARSQSQQGSVHQTPAPIGSIGLGAGSFATPAPFSSGASPLAHPDDHEDDVASHELAAYRAYALQTSPQHRQAREEQRDREIEAMRGVDRLHTSRTVQSLASAAASASAAAIHRQQHGSPHFDSSPLILPSSRAPREDESMLPTVLQSHRPTPLRARADQSFMPGSTSSRRAFGATLRTTPPDSPRGARSSSSAGPLLLMSPGASHTPGPPGEHMEEVDTEQYRRGRNNQHQVSFSPQPQRHGEFEIIAPRERETHLVLRSPDGQDLVISSPSPSPSSASSGPFRAAHMAAPALLSDHGQLVHHLAREEQHWDTRLHRRLQREAFSEAEDLVREQGALRTKARELEMARAGREDAVRAQVAQAAQIEAKHAEARLKLATKRVEVRGAKLALEAAQARALVAAQADKDEMLLYEARAQLTRKQKAFADAKALQARSAASLAQTLASQELVADRYARFEAEAATKAANERQAKNDAIKREHEAKMMEQEIKQAVLLEQRWAAADGSRSAGAVTSSSSPVEQPSSSLSPSSVAHAPDQEWKSVTRRMGDLLPPEAIAALPNVVIPPPAAVTTMPAPTASTPARSSHSTSAQVAPSPVSSPTLRDQVVLARDFERFARDGVLPASISAGGAAGDAAAAEFIPAFYSHLRGELASLHALQETVSSQQRLLLAERLATTEASQARFEELMEAREAAKKDEPTLIQTQLPGIDAQDAPTTEAELTHRRGADQAFTDRTAKHEAASKRAVAELEAEAETKRAHLRELDEQLEARRQQLAAINAAAATPPASQSAVPVAAASRSDVHHVSSVTGAGATKTSHSAKHLPTAAHASGPSVAGTTTAKYLDSLSARTVNAAVPVATASRSEPTDDHPSASLSPTSVADVLDPEHAASARAAAAGASIASKQLAAAMALVNAAAAAKVEADAIATAASAKAAVKAKVDVDAAAAASAAAQQPSSVADVAAAPVSTTGPAKKKASATTTPVASKSPPRVSAVETKNTPAPVQLKATAAVTISFTPGAKDVAPASKSTTTANTPPAVASSAAVAATSIISPASETKATSVSSPVAATSSSTAATEPTKSSPAPTAVPIKSKSPRNAAKPVVIASSSSTVDKSAPQVTKPPRQQDASSDGGKEEAHVAQPDALSSVPLSSPVAKAAVADVKAATVAPATVSARQTHPTIVESTVPVVASKSVAVVVSKFGDVAASVVAETPQAASSASHTAQASAQTQTHMQTPPSTRVGSLHLEASPLPQSQPETSPQPQAQEPQAKTPSQSQPQFRSIVSPISEANAGAMLVSPSRSHSAAPGDHSVSSPDVSLNDRLSSSSSSAKKKSRRQYSLSDVPSLSPFGGSPVPFGSKVGQFLHSRLSSGSNSRSVSASHSRVLSAAGGPTLAVGMGHAPPPPPASAPPLRHEDMSDSLDLGDDGGSSLLSFGSDATLSSSGSKKPLDPAAVDPIDEARLQDEMEHELASAAALHLEQAERTASSKAASSATRDAEARRLSREVDEQALVALRSTIERGISPLMEAQASKHALELAAQARVHEDQREALAKRNEATRKAEEEGMRTRRAEEEARAQRARVEEQELVERERAALRKLQLAQAEAAQPPPPRRPSLPAPVPTSASATKMRLAMLASAGFSDEEGDDTSLGVDVSELSLHKTTLGTNVAKAIVLPQGPGVQSPNADVDESEFDFDSLVLDASIQEVVIVRAVAAEVPAGFVAKSSTLQEIVDVKAELADESDEDLDESDLSMSLSLSTAGEKKLNRAKAASAAQPTASAPGVQKQGDLLDSLLDGDDDTNMSYELSLDERSYHDLIDTVKDPRATMAALEIHARLSVKRDLPSAAATQARLNNSNSGLEGLEIGGRPVHVVVTPSTTAPSTAVPSRRTSTIAAAISNQASVEKPEEDDEEASSLFGGFGGLARKKKKGPTPPTKRTPPPAATPVLAADDDDLSEVPSDGVMRVILRREHPHATIREGLVSDMLLKLETTDKKTGIRKGTVAFGVQMLLSVGMFGAKPAAVALAPALAPAPIAVVQAQPALVPASSAADEFDEFDEHFTQPSSVTPVAASAPFVAPKAIVPTPAVTQPKKVAAPWMKAVASDDDEADVASEDDDEALYGRPVASFARKNPKGGVEAIKTGSVAKARSALLGSGFALASPSSLGGGGGAAKPPTMAELKAARASRLAEEGGGEAGEGESEPQSLLSSMKLTKPKPQTRRGRTVPAFVPK